MRRSAWQRTITDSGGVPVLGVQINVFQADGITPATIFSTAAGAAQANPFVTVTPVAKFFALPGVYVIKATKDAQTQTFSDEEIGAKNYRDDQGALGGAAVIVGNMTADATIMSEGGSFRFTAAATGKPSFVNSGQVWAAPHDGTPFTFMMGVGLRAGSTRAAFIGSRGSVGEAPAWLELWDKGLNPAQTNLADDTAGALTTAGSFGWGSKTAPPSLAALGVAADNLNIPAGVYRVQAADLGAKPFGNTDYTFFDVKFNNSISGSRVAFGIGGEMYSFGYSANTPNSNGWRRQYDSQNALTPVAFAGGLSTGGLLEYGTNANGVYYKYADGRLECYFNRSVAMAANTEAAYTWTFPAAFVAAPSYIGTVIGGASVTNTFGITKSAYTTQTTTGASMRNQVTVAQTHQLTYCAVGRWR